MRPEAEAWWEQARADLRGAEQNLSTGLYYVAAFLSQQAAEKSLKALIVEKKRVLPPHSHNLADLGKLCGVPNELETALLKLNPDYVNTRYPDAANGIPSRMFNEEIAREHLAFAKRIVEWVAQQLSISK